MTMQVTRKISGTRLRVADLRELIEDVDDQVIVDVTADRGDPPHSGATVNLSLTIPTNVRARQAPNTRVRVRSDTGRDLGTGVVLATGGVLPHRTPVRLDGSSSTSLILTTNVEPENRT